MKIKLFFALVFASLTLISCDPSDSNGSSQNDDIFAQNFGSSVSKDFIGQVVDTDNNPIQNATIKIGTSTVQTDVNGVFIINGATVHEKFAYIRATKAGYIDGSRAMVPTSGKNNVKIMLISNAPLETIQSGVVSEVSIYSGTKVNFDGAFQDENGNAYTGAVSVSMFHLTPSDENIDKLMPGMLYAQTATNQEAVLETFGMLNVELRGNAGQKLNIAQGHTAEITMRIDDTQLATAPSSIPLWHFDEEKGYWKEDGVATKVGNKYVGEVSHFSWWNCDTFSSVVSLTVTIVDLNGNPLPNIGVGLTVNATNFNSYILSTDNNGQVTGQIPASQGLTLNVRSNSDSQCLNILYTATIGPFTSDTSLPNIVINGSNTANVVGRLLKCDNTNVTNGYVILNKTGNYSYSVMPVTNGAFSFNDLYCPNTGFTLRGVDLENFQETDSISYNFTTPVTNVGNLQACNATNGFISYQIDSNPTVFFVQTSGSYIQNDLSVSGYNPLDQKSINILGDTIIPGLYTSAQFTIEGTDIYIDSTNTTNTLQYSLNQFGIVGQYIDMTFNGNYNDATGSHTITGVVHVLRSY